MGNLCHQQPPAIPPRRSPRKAGDGAALPGSPLLLLLLLASSMSACKGEQHLSRNPAPHFFLGGGGGVPISLPAPPGSAQRAAACRRLAPGGAVEVAGLGAGQGRAVGSNCLSTASGVGVGGFPRVSRRDYFVLTTLHSRDVGRWVSLKGISFHTIYSGLKAKKRETR